MATLPPSSQAPYVPRPSLVYQTSDSFKLDPGIKRDSKGRPPLADRYPSWSNAPGHRSVQPTSEPQRQISWDNSLQLAQSPTTRWAPPTPQSVPPTPVSLYNLYDGRPYGHGNHPGHVPPPTRDHTQIEITQSYSTRRKAPRASQACDSCRKLKAKCDESKPCKTCTERNVQCVFRDPQPKQSDKISADIFDQIHAIRGDMTQWFAKVDHMSRGISRLENAIGSGQSNDGAGLKMELIEAEDGSEADSDSQADSDAQGSLSLDNSEAEEDLVTTDGGMDTDKAESTIRMWEHNDRDEKPGPPVAGKTKLPVNHTTSAGLLLKWPSIHTLTSSHLEAEHIKYVEEFPIHQEKARGLLRVCGAGEGSGREHIPSNHMDQRVDNIITDFQDDNSEARSSAPNSEVWGQTGGLSPAPGMTYRGGVTAVDGNPDFSPSAIRLHVQSFKDNILNMHPVMILEELDALVVLFLDGISRHTKQSNSVRSGSNPKFVSQPTSAAASLPEAVGAKRKRPTGGGDPTPSFNMYKPGRPFPSIQSAIVLLVCALGKICSYRDPIPDQVDEPTEMQLNRSPSLRNGGAISPIHGFPPDYVSHSRSSGLPSPKDRNRRMPSRRTSDQSRPGGVRSMYMQRNCDVIPGLEYFALATDILGSQLGGISLKHVYAWVLAGLYHGQLARAVESWSYIKQGCTVLQEVMRTSISRFHEIKTSSFHVPEESRRDNQVLLAYWTCLQLESDILAELPLSQSPILQHEDNMPYPSAAFVISHGYSPEVCASYFAQLHLRRQLNEIHSHLYDPDKVPQSPQTIDEGVDGLQTQLKNAREVWVPPAFRWVDAGALAGDILSARLRAKYWGSQVIIYRPFVRHLLDNEPIPYGAYKDARIPNPDSFASLGIELGDQPIPPGVDPRTLNYARLGIEALIQSTRAFHGMPRKQRIIVTNVFGTAHAQWGNLLTLAACRENPILCRFIDHETLSSLFSRTIEFFDVIAHKSSPLRSERNILAGLVNDLGLRYEDPQTGSSFSAGSHISRP